LRTLLRLGVPALAPRLKELREAAQETLDRMGCAPSLRDGLVLALGEAAMNVVQHGFGGGSAAGEITLEILDNAGELVFRLADNGPRADPSKVKPRDLGDLRPGGLGSHFIRQLMDETVFLPVEGTAGNLLEMRKRVSQP
jgi:sigma-B regulation protein RsbU (phosphoserine phosphatase)